MKSLFLKMFLWFCGAMIAIVAITIAGLVLDSPGMLATSWRALGEGAVVAIGRTSVESYERGGQAELARYFSLLAQDAGMRAALLDSHNREVSRLGFSPPPGVLADLRSRPEGELAISRPGIAAVRLRGGGGASYVFAAVLPAREKSTWARTFLGLIILAGGLLCYLLARHISAPVVHLRALTAKVSGGELAVRVTAPSALRRRDEIGGLSRDFNQMASRIETLMKAQQKLLADVSHELRSPITRLSLALGLMRRRGDPDAGGSLARMEREVERLNALIGQLLTLSRLECLSQPPPMEVFDLCALVREIASDADFEAAGLDRGVELAECEPCPVLGARDLIASAIENVVRNAVRYTKPNTRVTVRLARRGGAAVVVVEDEGPGVPEGELVHIFEPFYRVSEARERNTGGSGLGLAITHQVVSLHGGSVSAGNRLSGGLEIRITLPADPDPSLQKPTKRGAFRP
ncbi:MAG: HAMP domain-containing protein [Bryobacterales bacterium]|nr:HAMP domain-containing protein [Bryobacterales bacterium]